MLSLNNGRHFESNSSVDTKNNNSPRHGGLEPIPINSNNLSIDRDFN